MFLATCAPSEFEPFQMARDYPPGGEALHLPVFIVSEEPGKRHQAKQSPQAVGSVPEQRRGSSMLGFTHKQYQLMRLDVNTRIWKCFKGSDC